MQSVPLSAPTRAPNILIWSLAGLAALFLVWPVWRAFLPLEIWGNEGWNAYHADAAMRGAQLYPPPDGLVANNYPPLSFYIIGAIGRLIGDPILAGRLLSLVAVVWGTARPRALVTDPSGRGYVVQEGTPIGKNDGQVIRIGDTTMLVRETYVDYLGAATTKEIEMRVRSKAQGG